MNNLARSGKLLLLAGFMICFIGSSCNSNTSDQDASDTESGTPKIVNIVNFIRQCEPRIDWITEDVFLKQLLSR